jgi:predicted small secreted protein
MPFLFMKEGVIIMMKKWLALLLLASIVSLVLLACGSTSGSGGQADEVQVHMSLLQTSITI